MQKILVLGAGLSASYLIKYLLDNAQQHNWAVSIADTNLELARQKTGQHPNGNAIMLNASDTTALDEHISRNDIVVSMLPASMHPVVARICIRHQKHLVTASYISPEMQSLHTEALSAGVLLLNECGLDPGIDHLSAMRIIHDIEQKGGSITSFKSYCGGLVAPEFDDNPWNYKFTWNPRNVVVAGQATAQYIENGSLKFIPPSHIFEETEAVSLKREGDFESYANRDSLSYIEPYGITGAQTVLRGTLRRKGYSKAWNLLVKMGLTDDSFTIHQANKLTLRDFVSAFIPGTELAKLEERICSFLQISQSGEEFAKLKWLGLFEQTPIELPEATPAQILQQLLQRKWKLNPGELDMVVMKHVIEFTCNGKSYQTESELVVKGEDEVLTAMAKTVGLPLAIAVKNILSGTIKSRGVQMPLSPEFYNPILNELETLGVRFDETESPVN